MQEFGHTQVRPSPWRDMEFCIGDGAYCSLKSIGACGQELILQGRLFI
jgi:hypothetical protein